MKNKTNWFRVYFLLFYMGISVYTTYITIFFKGQGLTDSQIGLMQGIAPVAALLGLTLAGRLGDRTGKLNIVLAGSFLLSAVCALLFPQSKLFLYSMLINVCYTFATSPLLQLSDALASNYCLKHKTPFNTVKLMGSAGYALMALGSGYLLNGRENKMFIVLAVIFGLSAILIFTLPDERKINGKTKNTFGELLRQRPLLLLYAANLLVYIPISYYNSFFPIFIKDLSGEGLSAVAWSTFLSLLSEFPFLIFAHILCKKLGYKKILLASCLLMTVRWAALSFAPNTGFAMGINLLKGTSDIVFVYGSTALLNRFLPDRLKGSGQALLGILTYSVARIIGNYGGGVLSDLLGIRTVFLGCALFPVLAFVLLLTFQARRPSKNSSYREKNIFKNNKQFLFFK